MGATALDAGAEIFHGAENSALKNTAPFSLTPLRISENASIYEYPGFAANIVGTAAK